MTEGVGGCVGSEAKELVWEGEALPLTIEEREGCESRVMTAVHVPEGVPEFFPGETEVVAEAVEVGEDPEVVEGTF